MKKITLAIPDRKVEFFKELARELGFEIHEEIEIPEEHKNIVRERMAKTDKNPERLQDWEQVKDEFEID